MEEFATAIVQDIVGHDSSPNTRYMYRRGYSRQRRRPRIYGHQFDVSVRSDFASGSSLLTRAGTSSAHANSGNCSPSGSGAERWCHGFTIATVENRPVNDAVGH